MQLIQKRTKVTQNRNENIMQDIQRQQDNKGQPQHLRPFGCLEGKGFIGANIV